MELTNTRGDLMAVPFFQADDAEVVIFIAPIKMVLEKVVQRHGTAGSDASAVSLQLEKTASGTAAAGGTVLLATALNMKATADTVQTAELVESEATRTLNAGDAISLDYAGTTTGLANITLTMLFRTVA